MGPENKKLWFKAKRYGWGWYPSAWQGWLVLVGCLFVGLAPLVVRSYHNAHQPEYVYVKGPICTGTNAVVQDPCIGIPEYTTSPGVSSFTLGWLFLWIGVLLYIAYRKGEKPSWRWGK